MTNINNQELNWKNRCIYAIAAALLVSAAFFASYIPTIPSISGELYADFLQHLMNKFLLPIFLLSIATSGIFHLFMLSGDDYARFKKNALLTFAFVPYTLSLGFVALNFSHSIKADRQVETSLQNVAIEADVRTLILQRDFKYFIAAALIGYLVLLLYKRLYLVLWDMFKNRKPSRNTQTADQPQATEPLVAPADSLLDEAQTLANTFADPKPPTEQFPIAIEFYAFVHGEGFEYVVINEGITKPFHMGEGDTLDDFHGGIFLHINTALYIRLDHIMMIETESKFIMISDELAAIIKAIDNENIRKKIYSYRCPGKPNGYYRIHPKLLGKLKKTIKRFTAPE